MHHTGQADEQQVTEVEVEAARIHPHAPGRLGLSCQRIPKNGGVQQMHRTIERDEMPEEEEPDGVETDEQWEHPSGRVPFLRSRRHVMVDQRITRCRPAPSDPCSISRAW